MSEPIIWLHEEALRMKQPVFKVAPEGTKIVYVWDDDYFKQANYSLKRLVFIYETLCELPIDIIQGNALGIIKELSPSTLYAPTTHNPLIVRIINDLKTVVPVQLVAEEAFAFVETSADFRRFFQYWNKAEKTAFLVNGGLDA